MLIVVLIVMAVIGLLALATLAVVGTAGFRWMRGRAMNLERVHGFTLRPDVHYHPGHTWTLARPDGSLRVGLDDFARRLVSHVEAVRLPAPGSDVCAGEPAVDITCWGKRARLASPVTGVVTSVNSKVARDADPVCRDPYGSGWLFTVAPADGRFRDLLTGAAARRWFTDEADRLRRFFAADLGLTAADGGDLVAHPPAALDAAQWASLTRKFFGTDAEDV